MAKKRILIVDDEGYNKKCEKIRELMKQVGVEYEIAETLEEAIQKLFIMCEVEYDALILDKSFPKNGGDQPTGREGDLLLEMMEKRKKEIPVLIHSMAMNTPKSRLVANQMAPWEIGKFLHFLNYVAN